MSASVKPPVGSIVWHDLTVQNADSLRDFYAQVVGWEASPQDMGGYSDYNMLSPDNSETYAGVCHARGENANLPPVWLMYITVADLDASIQRCTELGGAVIIGPRPVDGQAFCVIRDPAGAVVALISQG